MHVSATPSGGLSLSIDGEVRTEMPLPNLTITTAGKCGVFTDVINTQAECLAAAQAVARRLSWIR